MLLKAESQSREMQHKSSLAVCSASDLKKCKRELSSASYIQAHPYEKVPPGLNSLMATEAIFTPLVVCLRLRKLLACIHDERTLVGDGLVERFTREH